MNQVERTETVPVASSSDPNEDGSMGDFSDEKDVDPLTLLRDLRPISVHGYNIIHLVVYSTGTGSNGEKLPCTRCHAPGANGYMPCGT
ncbi:hypothetical protein QYF36_008866 [Acer negundo]|nr:hypothetical protein QYF36_008866 [Acer negundo]